MDRFGGLNTLSLHALRVPEIGPDEVLLRVEVAGVGAWDPFEREGGYAAMRGTETTFPYILGSEGAGTIAAVGGRVDRFKVGERVYASSFLNPKGGFYAEYVAVKADYVLPIPSGMTVEQAGVMSGNALTALRGLEDTLKLEQGESLAIVGASGGMGHLAVQLAKRMGARVLAVASGSDGVALTRQLGADLSIDGREGDVTAAARMLAPQGIDAALLLAGGAATEAVLAALREGGCAAFPSGVQPEPQPRPGATLLNFNGEPDRELFVRLEKLLAGGPLHVQVARVFPLDRAADAQRALSEHHLGKLALRIA